MKICLYGADHKLGIIKHNVVIDIVSGLSAFYKRSGKPNPEKAAVENIGTDLAEFISNGRKALDLAQQVYDFSDQLDHDRLTVFDLDGLELKAPWPRRRIACAGGNFADHLMGMGGGSSLGEITTKVRSNEPWGFWKVPSQPTASGDNLTYPLRAKYLDYEGEVAIVLGKEVKNWKADRLQDVVWGVTLLNDFSIRETEGRASRLSFNLAKNFDGSVMLGPVIVVDEELDPSNIDVELRVNEDLRQKFNSSAMIWSFGELLEYLSRDFTFVPGDIISGGTAKGTAADSTPKVNGVFSSDNLFLKVGDEIELTSPQIGALRSRVIKPD